MHTKSAVALLGAVGLITNGCAGIAGTDSADMSRASLRRAQSCSDLSAALKEDARSKMNRRIDAEIRGVREGWGYGYGALDDRAANAGGATAVVAPPAAAPTASSAPPAAAPAHSNTETQVSGVDEADIVKTDGTRIYLLHGNQFVIVDSWPATSLAAATSVAIEGQPIEMFVADGRAVIFSRVDGTSVYSAAQVTPRPPYSDVYSPGGYSGGGVSLPVGAATVAPGSSPSGYPSYANQLAKVTILAISGAVASVTRELYFEGSYLSSRRIDGRVRVIVTGGAHGPPLVYSPTFPPAKVTTAANGSTQYTTPSQSDQITAWEALRTTNDALIEQTTYADWVPTAFAKTGAQVAASPTACQDFYVPTAGTTDFGMTQVESIDLNAPSDPPQSTAIVGSTSTVYENASALVLASEAYVDPWTLERAWASTNAPGVLAPGAQPVSLPVEPLNYTHLHVFDIASDPSTALYTGSGTVPGDVKDQFALDQSAGFVRVATTEQLSGPPRTDGKPNEVSHVFVLALNRGQFSITGDAGEIAPGEQLYATRFVGDKAYVVTWHVTDPLFVVDVGDPKNPHVLGQVQIPGFSTYIHPLDSTHLLTIGRETDDTGHQHSGSFWFGIAIQVFDVTNPLAPALQYKYVYDGGEYATTEAMDNHKAFTYFDDKKLLAFPYVHQGTYGASGPSSTLEVFTVDVAKGIAKIGSVSHAPLLGTMPNGNYGYCGGYFDGAVRRGVFIENFVYSISYGGIIASDVSALDAPVSTLKLDAPTLAGACP
jgi:uncharacterized secreted protein with C-terminal beta-propeller domain